MAESRGRGFKGYRFLRNRVMITVCQQPANAPLVDHCFSSDADRNQYQGLAILMFPSHRDQYGERESQRALILAFANPTIARALDPSKYRRWWRMALYARDLLRNEHVRDLVAAQPMLLPVMLKLNSQLVDSMVDVIGGASAETLSAKEFRQMAEGVNPRGLAHMRGPSEAPQEAAEQPLCMRCNRRNFMGRPLLNVGNKQMVCIDCWSFLTGTDDRDPIKDPTARSGSGEYVPRSDLG